MKTPINLRSILLMLAAIFGSWGLYAQEGEFGIKGGFNLQNVDFTNFNGQQFIDEVYSPKRNLGYHIGFFARIKTGPIFIQPEVTLTQVRSKFIVNTVNQNEQKITISFNRLDFPILAGLAAGPISIMAGPVLSFNLNEQKVVFENGLSNGSLGFQAAFQVEIKKYRLGLRYEGAFSNTGQSVEILNNTYFTDARTNQILVTFSINFLNN